MMQRMSCRWNPCFVPVIAAVVGALCAGGCGPAPGGGDTGARSTLDEIVDRGALVIGTEPEFPPFETVDENGEYQGFDIDLARALADDLGVELRVEAMAFQSLPTALQNGRIDLIISGMTATGARAKTLLYTDPYFRTGLCLLVGRDSGIARPEDLRAHTIAVKLGTTGEIVAQRMFPGCKLVRFDSDGACAAEVAQGRADAFIYDQLSIARYARTHAATTRALLDPITYEPFAMAIRQGDFVFWRYLNLFLDRVRNDGRYDALYARYFAELADDGG